MSSFSMLGLLGFLSNPHICCFRMEPSRSERGQLFWYPAKLRDEIIFVPFDFSGSSCVGRGRNS